MFDGRSVALLLLLDCISFEDEQQHTKTLRHKFQVKSPCIIIKRAAKISTGTARQYGQKFTMMMNFERELDAIRLHSIFTVHKFLTWNGYLFRNAKYIKSQLFDTLLTVATLYPIPYTSSAAFPRTFRSESIFEVHIRANDLVFRWFHVSRVFLFRSSEVQVFAISAWVSLWHEQLISSLTIRANLDRNAYN